MTPHELAAEVAGMISDRIGDDLMHPGSNDLDVTAVNACSRGATAFITLADGSEIWCHCVVHPPAADIPPRELA